MSSRSSIDLSKFNVDYESYNKDKETKEREQDKIRETREHIWRPQDGENHVRIIPYRHAKHNFPVIELYFHYNVGSQTVVCPQHNKGERCPICEYVDEKLAQRVPKEEYYLLMRIRAKKRYFSPVVDRDADGDPKVRFWGYPERVYEQIETFRRDPDYNTLFNALDGRDLTIKHEKPSPTAEKDGNWGSTQLVPRGKETPIFKDQQAIVALLEEVPEIDAFFPTMTYSEIDELFGRFLSGEDEAEEEKDAIEGESEGVESDELEEDATDETPSTGDSTDADDNGFDEKFKDLFEVGDEE